MMLKQISSALQANLSARLILTPKPIQLTAAEAQEALQGWIYKQPGMPTIEDCRHTLEAVADHFGYDESLILLQRYAVDKLTDLWIGAYEALVNFGNATVEWGVPPSSSWTSDNKPTYPPRWLVWHDASDSLFEVFNYSELMGVMSEGNCSDVTNVEKFEARFKDESEL